MRRDSCEPELRGVWGRRRLTRRLTRCPDRLFHNVTAWNRHGSTPPITENAAGWRPHGGLTAGPGRRCVTIWSKSSSEWVGNELTRCSTRGGSSTKPDVPSRGAPPSLRRHLSSSTAIFLRRLLSRLVSGSCTPTIGSWSSTNRTSCRQFREASTFSSRWLSGCGPSWGCQN